MRFIKFWKPTIVAFIILYASLSSGKRFDNVNFISFEHLDKIVHFIFYFTLTTTIYSSLYKYSELIKNKKIFLSLSISIFYGLLLEYLQYLLTTTRSAELFDFIFNTLGAITGVVIFPVWIKTKLIKYL